MAARPPLRPLRTLLIAALALTSTGCSVMVAVPQQPVTVPATVTATAPAPERQLGSITSVVQPACATAIPLARWYGENTTSRRPVFTNVNSERLPGQVAQRMVHHGGPGDAGRGMVELFKVTDLGSVGPGWTLMFTVWIRGELHGTYGIIGIEGFDRRYVYLSEHDELFAPNPESREYHVSYATPPNTDHVAVYMQAPEQYATSTVDIVLDDAHLYHLTPGCHESPAHGRTGE